jgi:hypothetical protein
MIPQSLQRLAYKPKFGRRPTCHRNKGYTNETTFLLPEYGFIFLRLPHALVVLGLTNSNGKNCSWMDFICFRTAMERTAAVREINLIQRVVRENALLSPE